MYPQEPLGSAINSELLQHHRHLAYYSEELVRAITEDPDSDEAAELCFLVQQLSNFIKTRERHLSASLGGRYEHR